MGRHLLHSAASLQRCAWTRDVLQSCCVPQSRPTPSAASSPSWPGELLLTRSLPEAQSGTAVSRGLCGIWAQCLELSCSSAGSSLSAAASSTFLPFACLISPGNLQQCRAHCLWLWTTWWQRAARFHALPVKYLNVSLRVKAVTAESKSSSELLVSNAQNLIQAVLHVLKATEAACIKVS